MAKSFDKAAWLAQKEQTKEKNYEMIKNIIDSFQTSPEKLLEFLEFQARFYDYSPKNAMLIYQQNPGAMFAGSFAAFKTIGAELAAEHKNADGSLPYYGVKKGAKAMKIFVPQTVTHLKDENGEWVQLSSVSEKLKAEYKAGRIESRQKLVFGIGNVFDISDTNIPTEFYPAIIRDGFGEVSERHKACTDYVIDFCRHHDIKVQDMQISSASIRGLARGGSEIELNTLLNDTGRLSTLLHEMGHTYLHFDAAEVKTMPTAQKEIEADMYSILMLKRFGFDVPEARQQHLLDNYRQLDDKDGKLLSKSFDRVAQEFNKTVQLITADMSKEISAELSVSADITPVMNMTM